MPAQSPKRPLSAIGEKNDRLPFRDDSVSIVIPTRNEVSNIRPLVKQIVANLVSLREIIFVDAHSDDGTRAVIRSLMAAHPIQLLSQKEEAPGLAAAIMAGAAAAKGQWLLVMDADLSHPPESMTKLLSPVLEASADMVIGSRYIAGGATAGWPLWRRLLSRLGALAAYPLTRVHDSLGGFFVISRTLLLDLAPPAVGFKIAFEVIVRSRGGLRVREIPIVFRNRIRGQSKMSLGVALQFLGRWLVALLRSTMASAPIHAFPPPEQSAEIAD